jgi:penicillin-binding protein 2
MRPYDTSDPESPHPSEWITTRREFLGLLLATLCFPIGQNSQAQNIPDQHFYFADLNSGIIHLPDARTIDSGKPGSLMKLVAAAAIVDQHLPSAYKTYDCKGAIIMNGQKYSCRHAHGRLGLVQAIAQSCNVFFCHASKELSNDAFLHYLSKFRLTDSLPEGILHSKTGKLRSTDLIFGTANGFELSAVQILQLVSLIARRGKMVPLQVEVKLGKLRQKIGGTVPLIRIADPQILGTQCMIKVSDPQFSDHTWNMLQQAMNIACQNGTAKNLDPKNKLHIAAKTGTTVHGYTFQSWIAGYFPYECPRYAFCLRAPSGTSYDRAVPLARQALNSHNWT